MDIFQNLGIEPQFLLLCVGGFCVVAIIIFLGLQVIGGALSAFLGLSELFFNVLAGGPIAWCGCLVFLAICGICAFIVVNILTFLPQCSTAEAVNFCRLLGY